MENKVSLFIPVYNAARMIRQKLRKCYSALSQLNTDFEIVFIDDNSTDQSFRLGRVINKARYADGKEIRYLICDTGPSRRENLAASFSSAKHELTGFVDADSSCDISFFIKAIDLLINEGADIVIGSRYIRGAKIKRQLLRRSLSFFYNAVIRIMFKSVIKDHTCGLKVFRKSRVMPIIEQMGYDDKYIRGWFWDAELLIRAQKAKLKIIEMPVEWREGTVSAFNIKRELRCLKSILKLKIELGKAQDRISVG